MMILGIIFAVIVVCMLTGAILHATYFKSKMEQIKPYGQMVDVFDGQMHVYTMGSGTQTTVLLHGAGGTPPPPSADFSPLMRQLSKKYTVVCIEYFGTGFSSQTQRERTCAHYVEEIRTALSNVGIKSPYVLIPHSISGLYSEYYASKYPNEVQAIICLEGTSTDYIGDDTPAFVRSLLRMAKFLQAIGVTSIVAFLTSNKGNQLSLGYTEKEINDVIAYAGFTINDVVLEQMSFSGLIDVIKNANKLPYPDTVPYLKIISKQTYERKKNKQLTITGQEYEHQHLRRIGNHAQFEILDGPHFIYHNNVERISKITDAFLSKED